MTGTGYTPSLDRVRDLYSWAYAWRTEDAEGETDLSGLRASQRAEFDRMIAAHDAALEAKVRAEERELCARVAENEPTNGAFEYAEGWDDAAGTIATRIRENR
ncbi:hypothetical protein [Microbacterium gilvum]|uniref:Uncharacterized protein n=1 Tax=Microbacterium gilvum TaxID=1336204 RepID=A0ABP9A766_9MICO